MKLAFVKGSTSVISHIFILDSSKTTGAGLTGLTNASGGLVCYYIRPDKTSSTSSTLNSITTLGTYAGSSTNSAFKEVDSTNMPGVYEFQFANNMLASGANQVVVMLQGATNMAPVLIEVQLTSADLNDGIHLGITALPNAAATSSGGLPTSGTSANQISLSSGRAAVQSNYVKNTALNAFEFVMVSSTDHITPTTGLTITATRSIDGGAFASTSNSATEVGSGVYAINLSASDLNGNVITFKFTATGADTREITLITTP